MRPTPARAAQSTVTLAAVALLGCTPALPEEVDPAPAAAATEPTATPSAAPPVVDLATVDLSEGVPLVARADGTDTSTVRLTGLDVGESSEIIWMQWQRPTDDPDEVFRVTQPAIAELRHLTRGPVAGISQQLLPPGTDELELLVVSDSAWELTAFRGGLTGLPDLSTATVTGSGPSWFAVSDPGDFGVALDEPDQATIVQAFTPDGDLVLRRALTPEQLDEPIPLPDGVSLVLLDVDGGWTVTPDA